MKTLLKKINDYLDIQEKKDSISISMDNDIDIQDIIDMVKKSDDMEHSISLLNDDIREKIDKLIEGGIL
jgi:hypothetical protein